LHFPAGRDLAWFQQLLAERPTVRYSRGRPVREWRAVGGARSEALDCRVYATAALHSLLAVGRSLDSMHAALPQLSAAERATRVAAAQEATTPSTQPRQPASRPRPRPRPRGKFRPRF
jgi:phage terminase large subunit GpA-like protein